MLGSWGVCFFERELVMEVPDLRESKNRAFENLDNRQMRRGMWPVGSRESGGLGAGERGVRNLC